MKQHVLLLTIAAFAGAGEAVAQANSINASQQGNSLEAVMTQQGTSHVAVVQQAGRNSAVVLTQEGAGHQAQILQDGVNIAISQQQGVNNSSVQEQYQAGPNRAEIIQGGEGNEAIQVQSYGESNTALIIQGSNSANNYARQNQSPLSYFNDAFIEQTGIANVAEQEQGSQGLYNSASITQSGNMNDAYQDQQGRRSYSNEAEIIQSGDLNSARQDQSTGFAFVTGTLMIMQSGNGNYTTQLQSNSSTRNEATVNQSGDNNMAFQDQSNIVHDNRSYVTQRGLENVASQTQHYSSNSTMDAVQDGGKSLVGQRQFIGSDNYMYVRQSATSFMNVSRQTQEEGNGNSSMFWQTGQYNSATSLQQGHGHMNTLDQAGFKNTAMINQTH